MSTQPRVEINLENIEHNLKVIKAYIGRDNTKIMAIVKSLFKMEAAIFILLVLLS